MKVVILEKPKMLKKYFEALKGIANLKIVTSIGHIEELRSPEKYFGTEKIYWNKLVDKFPFIPEKFELEITNHKQFNSIAEAIKQADEIILACDPDREGEAIHRNILKLLKEKGLVKTSNITRIWLHSETKQGILEAFNKRKDYMEYEGWYQAAFTRAIVDWSIGIQLTVLYSVKFGQPGKPVSIGRVQTWLLSSIIERYNQFKNFKSENFHTFSFITKENLKFNLIDSKEKTIKHFFDEKETKELENKLKKKSLTITKKDVKSVKEFSSDLFDLSTLQEAASKAYNFSLEDTLAIAQSLYEKHELLSYPRTDCKVITKEEAKELKNAINLIKMFPEYQSLVKDLEEENPSFQLNKKYVGEIKGHYALIPVLNYSKSTIPILTEKEKKLFDLVVKRFLAALFPPALAEKTTLEAKIEDVQFKSEFKNYSDLGFKKFFSDKEDIKISVSYSENDKLEGTLELKKGKTSPKPLFKAAGIVNLMKKAHLEVKDEKLKKFLKDSSGIGTAATRASFLPILEKRGYILKEKGNYIPTQKALDLYDLIPQEIKTPDFSAKLEKDMSDFIDGKDVSQEKILQETKKFLENVFQEILSSNKSISKETRKSFGICPICNKGQIIEGKKAYGCSDWKGGCKFVIWKEIASKKLTEKNVKDLLQKGKTGKIKGFETKDKSKKFEASLSLKIEENNAKVQFVFDNNPKEKTEKKKSELTCPICGQGQVLEGQKGYGCSDWKSGCKFIIYKEIRAYKLSKKNVKNLVKNKKTEKIEFKKKDGGTYSGFIILKDGKSVFSFNEN